MSLSSQVTRVKEPVHISWQTSRMEVSLENVQRSFASFCRQAGSLQSVLWSELSEYTEHCVHRQKPVLISCVWIRFPLFWGLYISNLRLAICCWCWKPWNHSKRWLPHIKCCNIQTVVNAQHTMYPFTFMRYNNNLRIECLNVYLSLTILQRQNNEKIICSINVPIIWGKENSNIGCNIIS